MSNIQKKEEKTVQNQHENAHKEMASAKFINRIVFTLDENKMTLFSS